MSTSNEKQYYVELTRHTLQVIRATDSAIEFCRECPIDQKSVVEETLSGWSGGLPVRAIAAVAPLPTHWHFSSRDETPRYRSEEALRRFAAGLSHGFSGPLEMTGCQTEDGQPIAVSGSTRWLLGVTPASAIATVVAAAAERRIEVARAESATLTSVGGAAAALRAAGSGHLLLWDIGVERSHVFFITQRGVEGITPCAVGFDAIFTAVQGALGLKLRGAAARLFFNDTYDFSETAARIASEIAPALKQAVAFASTSGAAPALACTGITAKQAWFVSEVARAAGLAPWTTDMKKVATQFELKIPATLEGALSSDALGMLHLVSSRARQASAWRPVWTQSSVPAPATAAVEAKAPIDLKPAVDAPAKVSVSSASAAPAVSVAAQQAVATVVPVPVPVVAIAKNEVKSRIEAKSSPPPPNRMQPKPEVRPAQKPEVKPAPKPEVKGVPVKPERPAGKGPAPVPTAPVKTPPPSSAPAPVVAARKRNYAVYIGAAVALVCALVAGKFYSDAQAATAAAEHQKAVSEQQLRDAEARAKQVELHAKAETERIRKEAEAAREAAVALARQQAEEQTRVKVSAEFEADRIAKSPGILIVTTSPAGAEVSIDGGPARKAPLSLNDIMPGQHRVSIGLTGYEPILLDAEIKGTKTTDLGLIQLQSTNGSLAISSMPDLVEFSMRLAAAGPDSEPVRRGRTPAQFDDVAPGDYVLTFSQSGWKDQTENVTVTKRAIAQVSTKFAGGSILLTSAPFGATVKRGGIAIGVTPLSLTGVATEDVSYEFNLTGYDPVTLSGSVVDAQQLRLHAKLLDSDRLANNDEVKTAPQPYDTPAPHLGGLHNTTTTEVSVSFVVWRDGTLRDIQTVGKVDPAIAKRCTEAVAKWKFHPAMGRDGHPLNVRVSLPIKITPEET